MKVVNKSGCLLNMSKDDYTRLMGRGIWLKIVDDEEVKVEKSDKIGVYLQRFTTGEKNCASDRIRGEWIINNSDKFEVYDSSKKYETVIFHKPIPEIAQIDGLKILDLCDSVWKDISNFNELIEPVDAIIVSTEGLKEEIRKITSKKVFVVPDGHDFKYYKTKADNKHIEKAKEVVWFGYAQNAKCLEPLIDVIKENRLELKAIAQCPLYPLNKADKFVKWDVDTCVEEISKADFAVLPYNGKLKSNNKDITAYLSGIPVAKNKADILRLIKPEERKKELEKGLKLAKEYDAKKIAKLYEEVIEKIKNDITVYTAICGDFDDERNDIIVFTDYPTDKFKSPVMNAKVYKVLSHKFFDSKYTVWIDGNIKVKTKLSNLIELLGDADIAVFEHPYRNCLFKEYHEAKKRVSKDNELLINKQIEDYKNDGMPHNFGLAECGMIIRKESPIVREFNNKWWAEICRYSERDQMSFPYVWWKMKDRIKIRFIEGNVRSHKYFNYENHKRSQ